VHDAFAVDESDRLKQISDEEFCFLFRVELLLLNSVEEFTSLAQLQYKANRVRQRFIHVHELNDGGMVAQKTQDVDLLENACQRLMVIGTSADHFQRIPFLGLIPPPTKVNH